MTQLKPSIVTKEAWSFTLAHFSSFRHLAFIPFLLSLILNSFAMVAFLQGKPFQQALIDGMGGLIEAFWGIRWFRYVLVGHKKNTLETFRFGKQEFLYFVYSFILLIPFMVDDFLFVKDIKRNYVGSYILFVTAFLILSLRFEFIFVSLALKKPTGLITSWQESTGYGWALFKSYSQSFTILFPIGILGLLGLGLLIIALWALGFCHFEGWTLFEGWQSLLNRNPLISILYVVLKESLWFWMQAFTMVIAARYYQEALKS